MARATIGLCKERIKPSGLDPEQSLKNHAEYKRQLDALQWWMLKIQQSYYHQKRRAVIVMEGVDARRARVASAASPSTRPRAA